MNKHFATGLTVCLSLGLAHASVAETTPSISLDLPQCINSPRDIAEIQRLQKANAKTSNKYDGYRNILHSSTHLELAARLAYAETLAANCPEQNDQIADLVTAVIANRSRIRHGDVESVVFQRNQFASSLNIYNESRYRDFLCPTDGGLWNRVLAKMRVNLAEAKPSAGIPQDAVNYYLYQHSARFKVPTWKLEEVSIGDEKTRQCVKIFRDPAWK